MLNKELPHTARPCHLLNLPSELRCIIYSYVMLEVEPIKQIAIADNNVYKWIGRGWWNPSILQETGDTYLQRRKGHSTMSIARTCRKIYEEYMPFVYGTIELNILVFQLWDWRQRINGYQFLSPMNEAIWVRRLQYMKLWVHDHDGVGAQIPKDMIQQICTLIHATKNLQTLRIVIYHRFDIKRRSSLYVQRGLLVSKSIVDAIEVAMRRFSTWDLKHKGAVPWMTWNFEEVFKESIEYEVVGQQYPR